MNLAGVHGFGLSPFLGGRGGSSCQDVIFAGYCEVV